MARPIKRWTENDLGHRVNDWVSEFTIGCRRTFVRLRPVMVLRDSDEQHGGDHGNDQALSALRSNMSVCRARGRSGGHGLRDQAERATGYAGRTGPPWHCSPGVAGDAGASGRVGARGALVVVRDVQNAGGRAGRCHRSCGEQAGDERSAGRGADSGHISSRDQWSSMIFAETAGVPPPIRRDLSPMRMAHTSAPHQTSACTEGSQKPH